MTPNSLRRHQAAYRSIVALTPPGHRVRYGESQVTLFGDMLAAGEAPLRLWINVIPDLLRVLACHRAEISCRLARASLVVFAALPIGVGLLIASTWLEEYGDVPLVFPITAAALVVQGTFGVMWLTRRVDRWRGRADRLFLTGEVGALALAVIVIVTALTTRTPTNPESLRLLAGGAAALHAVMGLTAFRLTRRPAGARSVPD